VNFIIFISNKNNISMEDSLEFIYDTDAKAIEKLARVISKEEVDRLLEIMYSSDILNKKIGWGLIFGLEIDPQLKKDVIAEFMATCDPIKHLQDMFTSYQEITQEWRNQ
jgi:hypothetical protein